MTAARVHRLTVMIAATFKEPDPDWLTLAVVSVFCSWLLQQHVERYAAFKLNIRVGFHCRNLAKCKT